MAAKVELFPIPTSLAHSLVPRSLPGSTYESFLALQECLKHNHENHHIFFDKRGFHNHIAHHLLALWSFGASGPRIKQAYAIETEYQRPITLDVDPSELEVVTDKNFVKHLGDERYFSAYIKYFTPIVESMGPIPAIEKYVFSEKYNRDPTLANEKQPEMLSRYVSAIYHSMIQAGYGIEFGLPGVVIEGLAQCCVHGSEASPITPSLFPSYTPLKAENAIHAFTVVSRVIADPNMHVVLKPPTHDGESILVTYYQQQDKHLHRVLSWIDEWLAGIDVNDANISRVLESKMEELIWACAVMYGVGGWSEGKDYVADFVMMHFATGAIFMPTHFAVLKPLSQLMLMRSYFAVTLIWYIVHGRPSLDFAGFYKATTTTPKIFPGDEKAANAWVPIIEASLTHPDEHLIKLQRALAHFSILYGTRRFDHLDTELKGVENLDGTVFIRIAGISQLRMEKDRYVDMKEIQGLQWDRAGYFE